MSIVEWPWLSELVGFVLFLLGFGVAVVGVVALVMLVCCVVNPKFRCWIKTGHAGSTALGSYMSPRGPRYGYHCQKCGAYWSEDWECE